MKTRMQKGLALLLTLCLVGTAVCATTLLSFAEEETLPEVRGEMEVIPAAATLLGVQWALDDAFAFYEENGETLAKYYYGPTQSDPARAYAYATTPEEVRDMCEVHVSSSDERVMKVDEETKRLIPVGNGSATLTVSATMDFAGGKITKTDEKTVTVSGSPYTPVTGVQIEVDREKTDEAVFKIRESKGNTLRFNKSAYFFVMAAKEKQGTFDQKKTEITLDDGRKFVVFDAPQIEWSSSDTKVLTVDRDGKVTAVGPGKADVFVRVTDNGSEVYSASRSIRTEMTLDEALEGFILSTVKFDFRMTLRYFAAIFNIIVDL